MKRIVAATLATILATAAPAQTAPPAAAAAAPNILDRAVNQPGIAWAMYGAGQSAKQVAADKVPGGAAVHVVVKQKGANAWDAGASYPTNKPIAAGDTILVAVYLRAPDAKPGETLSIPIGATGNEAPYPSIAAATVQPTAEWKIYYASGVAPKACALGKAGASVQLAGSKQVVELGPVFILDFGQNYDASKLPKN